MIRIFQTIASDGAALAGAGFVTFGAWQIYAPAGYIVGGFCLILIGIAVTPRSISKMKPRGAG